MEQKCSGEKIKPKFVVEYNKYMKGVDRADQYMYVIVFLSL